MLALAVLTGLQGADAARRVIVVLPLTWLIAGVLAGALAGSSSPVPDWLLLGALLLIDRALSPRVLTAIAVRLGLLLGAANGSAMAQADAGLRGVIGIVAALFVTSKLVAAMAVFWHGGWHGGLPEVGWLPAGCYCWVGRFDSKTAPVTFSWFEIVGC